MTAEAPTLAIVRLRDAAGLGLTRGVLRTRAWEPLTRGIYAPRQEDRALRERLGGLLNVLPRNSAFGHLTSAELRGWWLPHRLGRHVPLATTSSSVHIQRRGLYVRRSNLRSFETLDGLPVVSAEQTLVELARDLTLVDLVPFVDQALAAGADPALVLRMCRRQRGAVALREALYLGDARSESW
jgi:hypothetical protein